MSSKLPQAATASVPRGCFGTRCRNARCGDAFAPYDGIDRVKTDVDASFDHHEVILCGGAWSESFQPDELALIVMGKLQRAKIFEIFPDLREKKIINPQLRYEYPYSRMRRGRCLDLLRQIETVLNQMLRLIFDGGIAVGNIEFGHISGFSAAQMCR